LNSNWVAVADISALWTLNPEFDPVKSKVVVPSFNSRFQSTREKITPIVPVVTMSPVALPAPTVRLTLYVILAALQKDAAPSTNVRRARLRALAARVAREIRMAVCSLFKPVHSKITRPVLMTYPSEL